MATVRKREWQSGGKTKSAWVATYSDQDGKRRIKTFETKKAANEWLAQTQHEVKQGIHTPERSSITVAAAGEMWVEQAVTDRLEASTVRQYRQHLDLHIKPFIGRLRTSAESSPPRACRVFAGRGAHPRRSIASDGDKGCREPRFDPGHRNERREGFSQCRP